MIIEIMKVWPLCGELISLCFEVVTISHKRTEYNKESGDNRHLGEYAVDLQVDVTKEVSNPDEESGPDELSDDVYGHVAEEGDPDHAGGHECYQCEAESVAYF